MIEKMILSNLLTNEEYARQVLPHIKSEYFIGVDEKVFRLINSHFDKFNVPPTKVTLKIDASNEGGLTEEQYKKIIESIDGLDLSPSNTPWLVEQTEKYCQDKAIYNALMKSVAIVNGQEKNLDKGAIPEILSNALSISFDVSIGHSYLEDWEQRYERMRKKENRIPFALNIINKITRGGVPKKTLNVLLAGTGVGKSQFMCDNAAAQLLMGYNVLYITLEMSEDAISKRIDANLLNIPMDELELVPKDVYEKKITKIKEKTTGKLKVKEYPTSQAGAAHFRFLLSELRMKENFVPDIIYVDYINICMSSRFKPGKSSGSYEYVKAIAEELRGLAVEFDVPLFTATQLTRSGYSNSDPGLDDTAESFGLPATADFMFALITTEELEQLNQIMGKQLKNRYSDPNRIKRFTIGVDRPHQRFYDVENSVNTEEQTNVPAPKTSNSKFDKFNLT